MGFTSKSLCFKACLVLAAVLGIQTAWGQATTSLRGTVNDPQGAAIDGASVQLQDDQTGFRRTVLTDATGVYQFAEVPPGTYTVVIEKPGFAVLTQQRVALAVNTPSTLNVAMQVASVNESVNVEAEVLHLNTV